MSPTRNRSTARVVPGTDCDDANPMAFPGAAELESPPGECMLDADDDGWGDANPGDDYVDGSDCHDGNVDPNPDTLALTTFLRLGEGVMAYSGIATVDPADAGLDVFASQDLGGAGQGAHVSTAALDASGTVLANDLETTTLQSVTYTNACTMELTPVGASYAPPGNILCGLEYGGNGMLYGIDHYDNLLTFDPASGQITSSMPIETQGIPLNINACDMAYDCTTDRMLVANGINSTIYSVDPSSGVAQSLRDLGESLPGDFSPGASWKQVGLAYDPVDHLAYLAVTALSESGVSKSALYRVDVDGAEPPAHLGYFVGHDVVNLQYLPICP